MNNPPLILFPPEYSGGNFFKRLSKTVCINTTHFDIHYWSVNNTADDTLHKIIVHEFDDSLFKCLINTEDYNTRKYLLNSVVSDYVHPTIDEVIKIINCNKNGLPPHILKQISRVIKHCSKYFYTSFSDDFLNIPYNKFNVFDIFRNDVFEHYNYKIIIPYELTSNMAYFFKILLVHKSLFDLIDRG